MDTMATGHQRSSKLVAWVLFALVSLSVVIGMVLLLLELFEPSAEDNSPHVIHIDGDTEPTIDLVSDSDQFWLTNTYDWHLKTFCQVANPRVLSITRSPRLTDFSGMSDAAALEELAISQCPNANWRTLPILQKLESLTIGRESGFSDNEVSILMLFPHLSDLDIVSCAPLTDAGVSGLYRLPALRSLSIAGAPRVTVRSVLKLYAIGLHDLRLGIHFGADDELAGWSRFTTLRSLDLSKSTGLTDSQLSTICAALPATRVISPILGTDGG